MQYHVLTVPATRTLDSTKWSSKVHIIVYPHEVSLSYSMYGHFPHTQHERYNTHYDNRWAGQVRCPTSFPNSKVHRANMGPIWGRQDPDGPHVGPMNFAIWVYFQAKRNIPEKKMKQKCEYRSKPSISMPFYEWINISVLFAQVRLIIYEQKYKLMEKIKAPINPQFNLDYQFTCVIMQADSWKKYSTSKHFKIYGHT